MEFFLTGQPGERQRFVKAFEEFCRAHHVPDTTRHAADLALEEHLTNVLAYGFKNGGERWVSVELHVERGALVASVADNGDAYNPLNSPPVDTSVPLEDKPIGGLGVYLMKQVMDELTYARNGGMNVLRMSKGYKTPWVNGE